MISLKQLQLQQQQQNQHQQQQIPLQQRQQYRRELQDFDSLFLIPKCAFASDKAMNLRKDLAAYNFNIKIFENTPKGNVWICKLLRRFLFFLFLTIIFRFKFHEK